MRYLILTAGYNSFLRDEFDGEFHYSNLSLPIELIEKLEEWYEKYSPIIQLNSEERMSLNNEIMKLDEHGIKLAKEIIVQLREKEVKVKYFSEGLLRYIMF